MPTEGPCYTIVFEDNTETPTVQELRSALEKGSDEDKLETLRKIIVATINGNSQPALLMSIIQYIMPSKNKQLKKLLHFYWEVCPKYDENGKLKQEMILVVNAIRNDLQHPNEYIRGATLRFLQKISREAELLEPLIPTLRANLEHRHSYVRRAAVFALQTVHREHPSLVPDAAELMQTFLAAESDASCKRNALVFLANVALPRAVEWLRGVWDGIVNMDEGLQMAVVEVARLDCARETTNRPKYIRAMFELLGATSHAVKYEAATTLTTLTQNGACRQSAPSLTAAASCLVTLAIKELIVLDRLDALRERHRHILDGSIMDVLQVLSSADMEVRRKAMSIVLSMTSGRNAEDVVLFLKKQLLRTQEQEFDKASEYRQLLIQSIHVAASDSNNPSALDVVAFVREVVEKFPALRPAITEKLTNTLMNMRSGKVFRGVLWILGEYMEELDAIEMVLGEIRKIIGEIPVLAAGIDEQHDEGNFSGTGTGRPRVLADGTYATETAYSVTSTRTEFSKTTKPPLRALILGGDFFTGAVLAVALTKLVLRYDKLTSNRSKANSVRAEAMLTMTSILRVGQSKFVTVPIDEDSNERIMGCIQSLSELNGCPEVNEIFLKDSRTAYAQMLGAQEKCAADKKAAETVKENVIQVDDLLVFRQFSKKSLDETVDYLEDLGKATGAGEALEDFISNLSRISQLTGKLNPWSQKHLLKSYAFKHSMSFPLPDLFDTPLDVLLVNQTSNTLQNLCLDFATLGDLKLVERPTVHTIAPHGFQSIKATIKVSSTETGVIFGSILWDGPNLTECCVILNDIHIDIMDYIKPAYCSETQFRSMWTEFEWENRVNVSTKMTDTREYLKHVMQSTNMSCLTPEGAMSGDCDFLSANMYARSLFGEDALANLSIEKTETGAIAGHVRIRSKTQGIALSLGDRITMCAYWNRPRRCWGS
ncbi:coatomer beta subunit appendage platform-domain-containing protein [Pisolithus croceorrhizus]|nr:coatomer beta subunit appendage platform-domain-containing protein [Pisolithus croceorrhizus]